MYFAKSKSATTLGKGDLIGCDINKQLLAQSDTVMVRSGTSGGHQRRTSIGAMGMSEVVVKSNADVRALTYCDLKVAIYLHFLFSILWENL